MLSFVEENEQHIIEMMRLLELSRPRLLPGQNVSLIVMDHKIYHNHSQFLSECDRLTELSLWT